MRSTQWSELSAVVDKLLDAPPEERDALIQELSGGDPGRRQQLESVRRSCEETLTILDRPAAQRFAALFDDPPRFPEALRERYRVTRELGRGGMAIVYLARDLKHARDVAVKVMAPTVAAVLGADRFIAEIAMVAQMHHPHIVPLYDSGQADGTLYYVMPYEPGLSLRQRLARDGRLAPEEVVLILRDLCDALAYAHARGIVHRDIKPDNVLLSGRHALVTDFGIATVVTSSQDRLTTGGVAQGTPAYMAPEQIAGAEPIDHRADIYAVGVLGYELLAGHPPFTGETRQAILAGHLHGVPPSLVGRGVDMPPGLAELVMQSLEKAPGNRPPSAEAMVRQLEGLATPQTPAPLASRGRRWKRAIAMAAGVVGAGTLALVAWRRSTDASWQARWSRMHIERITDFPGSEVDGSISPDGKLVAFLADRDSVFDAFVSQVETGRVENLTRGHLRQLFNEDVRNVGFSRDGAQLWLRIADLTAPASVSFLPTRGGALRPFLPTAVMVAWSPDGTRLAYHETTPGDPIFVAGAGGGNPRRIYIAPPGVHSHYLAWSPDGRYLYFAHGLPPDEMDIWRLPSAGGQPERITAHNSRVGYPVLLDARTLLYTASDDDGTGPWLYMMDLESRVPTRLSSGVEHFISIAASAEQPGQPRRLVATVSNPTVQLWSVPIADTISSEASASAFPLPTARSAAPRFAPDSLLLYLASRSGADGLWRLSPTGADELWSASDGAVVGAAAVSPTDGSICFAVRRRGRSRLTCTNAHGGAARTLAPSLDVRGAPSWSPDGRWISMAARVGEAVRIFKIPVQGGPPVRLVDSASSNPVWSPDGTFILYSGTPRGRSVPLQAVTPDGAPFPLPVPSLLLDRLGDSYQFLPHDRGLVVKLGGFRHQDFWLLDLTNGKRRQITRLRPGESLSRFDISPDGKRIVFERAQENSDIALIELPALRKRR